MNSLLTAAAAYKRGNSGPEAVKAAVVAMTNEGIADLVEALLPEPVPLCDRLAIMAAEVEALQAQLDRLNDRPWVDD